MNIRTLSTYILQALATAQVEGRASNLETLREELQVRRNDIRAAVSQLHREGMLDVLRMRLTLQGFAIGQALVGETLPALRPASTPQAAEPGASAQESAPPEAARPATVRSAARLRAA